VSRRPASWPSEPVSTWFGLPEELHPHIRAAKWRSLPRWLVPVYQREQGHPLLDPYRATQFDVTYEYYFGKQGLINGDVFYKSVDSFVEQATDSECIDNPTNIGGCSAGPVTAPHNGTGGKNSGP